MTNTKNSMMKYLFAVLIALFFTFAETIAQQYRSSHSSNKDAAIPLVKPVPLKDAPVFDYTSLNSLLAFVNTGGQIDYVKLKSHFTLLDKIKDIFARLDKKVYDQFHPSDRLAFWINLYNLILIDGIVKHLPLQSPLDIGNMTTSVFQKIEITLWGESFTLDRIFHEIIRDQFQEPRVHCVINYGTISSPRYNTKAFTGKELNTQLHDACIEFINDQSKNKITDKKATISQIFQWYTFDFLPYYAQKDTLFKSRDYLEKAVLTFIYKHVDKPAQRSLKKDDFLISYLEFDWNLNIQ